ncbi:hypothetical protein [Sulfobacillus harzensis]|uniref:Uncharacterized protein n=1 Tax=Sulfobacillus harzensis TaxID=2729629 RepID=A0A7Y0L8C0_9FIRM|nr:hypothetical protein [Sulfobacillus harzensis]NMP24847.1 hypothetical protein [Sulfobacillus harzensis]
MPKRAKLTGVDRLFENAPAPFATKPQDTVKASGSSAPKAGQRWDDRYHRRTFYCEDENWAALQAWCKQTGTSHSAALNAALKAFLNSHE